MANYDVTWGITEKPTREFGEVTPVCVEIWEGSQPLSHFEHPQDALYIFGPEDGEVPQALRVKCHYFVHIPAKHCLNVAAAVYVVLADRYMKAGNLSATTTRRR